MASALVTGANRGLGLETCRQLLSRGFSVLLGARDITLGRDAANLLARGGAVRAVQLDIEDPESIERLAAELEGQPPLDALVNNAGIALDGFDENVANRTIDVNYRGAVRVTDALLPRLAPDANIVMVSSGAGELTRVSPDLARELLDPALGRLRLEGLVKDFVSAVRERGNLGGWPRNAYSVSKVAMNAFTRILARELALDPRRIKVNAVCPGWVRTRMGGSSASRDVKQGASGIAWAATLDRSGPNGGFFRDQKSIEW
jgi:NAD(P)-dependent dehydrogenase (short-subunit alcohol dehydrogenase family)